jgi:hypothetical protein
MTNKIDKKHKELVNRVILTLSPEQINYILMGYLDDESDEDLRERLK